MNNIVNMRKITDIFLLLLSASSLCCCGNDEFARPDYYSLDAATEMGKAVVEGTDGYVTHVKSDSQKDVMDGVTLFSMSFLNSSSHAVQMYIYKVNLESALVQVGLPDNELSYGTPQKSTLQAKAVEDRGTYLVMGGISGGAFDEGNGRPKGILYHKGICLMDNTKDNAAFFAVLDSISVCLDTAEYVALKPEVEEAVGGTALLLKNGYLMPESDATGLARTAVGTGDDGKTVYLAAVDGGDFFYSNGIGLGDLGRVLKACGATDAISLDSGDNVTAFWRDEMSDDLFLLLNRPSNNGLEIPVGNTLLILQK